MILQEVLPFLLEWASEGEVSEAEIRFALNLGLIILDCLSITYQNLPETGDNPGKSIGWGAGGLTGLTGFHFLVPTTSTVLNFSLYPQENCFDSWLFMFQLTVFVLKASPIFLAALQVAFTNGFKTGEHAEGLKKEFIQT